MVRTTIACAWCRRSKIKCVHDGSPPCRNCLKSRRLEPNQCTLSGPFDSTVSDDQRDGSVRGLPQATNYSLGSQPSPRPVSQVTPQGSRSSISPAVSQAGRGDEIYNSTSPPQDIVSSLPASIIIQSVSVFARKFPELAFIHLSSFSGRSGSFEHVQRRNHIAAILSLCAQFLPSGTLNLQPPESYAKYTREKLSRIAMDPPSITIVQTLLTIAMYEWGNANGYGAWMYSGMATRMIQSIQVLKRDRNYSEREKETQNRTFWACFVMDRLIFCGKSQTLLLPMDRMTCHLPVGDLDFAFGNTSNIRYTNMDITRNSVGLELHNTIDYQYSVLVRGFDICAKVLEWVISGGRRQPGMSEPENCPWMSTSPWNSIYGNLEKWRSMQCLRLHYPLSPVAIHVSVGNGEPFAYINLLYYVCILFLNREYIPFLPTSASEPQGPVDPPHLNASGPTGWWSDRAAELFNAAKCITAILEELDELDSLLITPFAGFCAFSAAAMNLYVAAFPRMNLERSEDATALAHQNIVYLNKFRQIWKIGEGWWKTIEQTQILYTHATSDRALYRGKTRADFAALEASIHDYSGASPLPDNMIHSSGVTTESREINHNDQAAAISLQELSSSSMYQQRNPEEDPLHIETSDTALTEYGVWNDVWSIWGEQQILPYALGTTDDFSADLQSHQSI